ncbi:hypothetical protein [Streptomyces daliensis]
MKTRELVFGQAGNTGLGPIDVSCTPPDPIHTSPRRRPAEERSAA